MILNLGSLAFNANIETGGGTPAWGTELGQGEGYKFAFEDMSDFFTGMVYKSIPDIDNVTCPLGKGGNQRADYDFVIASLFNKIYVNGKKVSDARFLLLVVKKLNGEHHVGRRTIKYNPRISYHGEYINEDCYSKMALTMGLTKDAAWFVYEMLIVNQDELHFTAFELGKEPQIYRSNDERKNAFISRLPKGTKNAVRNNIEVSDISPLYRPYLAAIKTKPFLILGGFSGTGKSQKVKELAFLTCPNDDELSKKLGNTENTPGNYCLVSVRPNGHDSTDLLGYYSSINDKYIVTDFVRFLVKAMQYKDIPFFVCLDEMNLAPVEEYFAEFLSVLESRKKVGDEILTDPLLSADWFNKKYKEYNIFDDLGLKRIGREQSKGENRQAGLLGVVDEEPFDRMDIVESLQKNGLCLPQNVVVIGTVNMDDTTNSFSRKVIDRAMTFETIVEEFGDDYYNAQDTMTYGSSKKGDWTWILPDEVRANEALEHASDLLDDGQKKEVTNFINEVNACLKGSPFQIAYRILNETILYYRATKIVNQGEAELNKVFDDILMQKVLPRIEGDYDKTYKPLAALKTKAETKGWTKSKEKIDFMLDRFSKDDQGGFTSFWN